MRKGKVTVVAARYESPLLGYACCVRSNLEIFTLINKCLSMNTMVLALPELCLLVAFGSRRCSDVDRSAEYDEFKPGPDKCRNVSNAVEACPSTCAQIVLG